MYQESPMTEGRKCQILLPDDRRLEILIQPKLHTSELLDIVASHFKLKEKEYFGLAFQDETGHYNWLQSEKKVLEHDLPRKQGTNLVIAFLVRFYVESITQLRDTATVELFYLTAKQSVFKGQIECDSETVFELAAHVLQATLGDYVDDVTTKNDLKKLPVITTSALKEHPSIQFCEERVIDYYKKIAGTAKGLAIVNYMTIVEGLPTYGIHYFEVKDKKDIPWWLGISNKGIGVFDKQDKNVPRRMFVWKSLENLYYRDKKFSIEVHDPKRVVHTLSSFNLYEDAIREPVNESDALSDAITDPTTQVSVSRRTFGPGNVNVHAWFGATPQLTKCVWCMAVAQHQFYHERKASKTSLPSARSVSELASELSRSTSSLPGSLGSDISRSGSSASLPSLSTSRFDLNFDPADTAKVQREMYTALKARRDQLEELLRKKTEELKLICVSEGELTGRLPRETPLAPGEEPPQIRRRVGTAFSLNTANIVGKGQQEEDASKKLELELELQRQITSAAHKLASDKSVSRFVRKQRRQSFVKAQNKLKDMEKKLAEYRKGGDITASPASTKKYDDSEVASPAQSPLVPRGARSNYKQHEDRAGTHDSSLHRCHTAPRNLKEREREIVSMTLPQAASSPSLEEVYKPNTVYTNRYRDQNYPTLATRSQSQTSNAGDFDTRTGGPGVLEGSRDSGFSSTNNMYNVNSRRTSRYESNQDLVSPGGESHYETLDGFDKLSLQSKRNNLDNISYKQNQNYGSLERNVHKSRGRGHNERKLSDADSNSDNSTVSSVKFAKRTSRSEFDLTTAGKEKTKDYHRSTNELTCPNSNTGVKDYSGNSGNAYTGSRSDTRFNSRVQDSAAGQRIIELPVKHETARPSRSDKSLDCHSPGNYSSWSDLASTEPSPIIQSPTKKNFTESYLSVGGTGDPSQGQCYSPRSYEGSQGKPPPKPPHTDPHSVNIKYIDSPHGTPKSIASKIVTVKMSPHVEMSKPFEMSDYFKYSEKLRRQRLVEQYHQALVGSRTPSQSSDSDNHSVSSYHRPHGASSGAQHGPSTPTTHPAYRGGNSTASPVSSRHMVTSGPYTTTVSYNSTGDTPDARTPTYGVSTTTSRVQYTVQTQGGRVLYKSQHQSSKQTHYQPPGSMKCEPVRTGNDVRHRNHEAPASTSSSDSEDEETPQKGSGHHRRQYSTPERSVASPLNMSNFHLSPAGTLSKAFSNEMLEWYDGEGNAPTSV